MTSFLIADSGSTKTDWCLIKKTGKPVIFKTSGINPYLQSSEQINMLLAHEMGWNPQKHKADKIFFYGAGASTPEQQKKVANALKTFFTTSEVEVLHDMLAAARAMCGNNKGIVSILGTGSNSCYYDGKKIKEQQVSLGYIAGDEGSGNYMGKRILQYYAYNTFDTELKMSFEKLFGNDIQAIIKQLYSEPFPNRYLATFVLLLRENRGHFMIENIIEDAFNEFFHNHILKYRQSWKLPLYFTGSIAYGFRDVIQALCNQYELELGDIEQTPMTSLVKYHKQQL